MSPSLDVRWPTLTPVADHAMLVAFGRVITNEARAAVISLDRALTELICLCDRMRMRCVNV